VRVQVPPRVGAVLLALNEPRDGVENDELWLVPLAFQGQLATACASVQRRGLVESLTAYLRHNGQMESASSALGVHRHTIRNRLLKVRELTQCDLDSTDTRAELWLAIKARELMGMHELCRTRAAV